MPKNNSSEFKDSIKKLRSLREKLCEQQLPSDRSLNLQSFVICELQDIHKKLQNAGDHPKWCMIRIEHIIEEILSLSDDDSGDKNE